MLRVIKKEVGDNEFSYTFYTNSHGTVEVKSGLDLYHENPLMTLMDLEYDRYLFSLWYGMNNKDNYLKLKSIYIDDKEVFKKEYKDQVDRIIAEHQKEIAEQERLLEYWTVNI